MKKLFNLIKILVFLAVLLVIIIGVTLEDNSLLTKDNKINNLHIIDYRKLETKKVPLDISRELQKSTPLTVFKVPILLYHYVEYVQDKRDTIRKSFSITPNVFEEQIKTLLNNGYTFITSSDLGDALDNKAMLPENPVIMTFDDGYGDFYQDVLPILKKYKVRATAYIIPGFIDKLNYMTKKELEEVVVSGLVEIGAHTMNHMYLRNKPYNTVKQEVDKSKIILEEMFRVPVVSFAYPYGAFDKQAIGLVKEAGFKTAATTIPGNKASDENRYFIYRIRPGIRMGKELIDYLKGDYFRPY